MLYGIPLYIGGACVGVAVVEATAVSVAAVAAPIYICMCDMLRGVL